MGRTPHSTFALNTLAKIQLNVLLDIEKRRKILNQFTVRHCFPRYMYSDPHPPPPPIAKNEPACALSHVKKFNAKKVQQCCERQDCTQHPLVGTETKKYSEIQKPGIYF